MSDIIIHEIDLDLYTYTSYPVIKAQQLDVDTRFLRVYFKDHGETYILPDQSYVVLEGMRPLGSKNNPEGRGFAIPEETGSGGAGSDNVTFNLTQAITRDGIATANVVIYMGNSIISSIPVYIDIEVKALDDESYTEEEESIIRTIERELNNHIGDSEIHRRITYSATEPTNHANGDIWLQEYT